MELKAGGVPTATMYDDEEKLNDALAEQKAAREQAQAQAHHQALEVANFYAYQHHSLPYQPAPPHLDMPFVHPGQMVQHNQYMAYHPGPQPQFNFYVNGFAPPTLQPTEYNPQFQPAALYPQYQDMSMQADTTTQQQFSANMAQETQIAAQPAAIQPQYQDMTMQTDTMAVQQFAAHMVQEEQIAAQPSANPTRSCCGSRPQAAQPSRQPTSSPFNIPGSRPKEQFGCQNCASFECTCIECPELSQEPSGAWSKMCGRGGELGGEFAGEFDVPLLLKQEYSSSQDSQDMFQGISEHQTPLQDFSQGLLEHQTPLQNFSQQPPDVYQHPQEGFHQSQGLPQEPQDLFYRSQDVLHQSQVLPQQPQDAFQGLLELQAPLEDYSQLPSADVPHLPEFQFGQPPPSFDETLGYDELSDISTRW